LDSLDVYVVNRLFFLGKTNSKKNIAGRFLVEVAFLFKPDTHYRIEQEVATTGIR